MSHYPLLREASSRSLGLGSSEHPSDFSYSGPRPFTSGIPSTKPQGNPAYRPTACLGPNRLTIHTGWTPRRPVTRMPRITTLPPNVTCRRVTHPSTDCARCCLKLTCHHINRRHFCFNIKSISVHPLLWMNVMLDIICMVFAGMWTTFR